MPPVTLYLPMDVFDLASQHAKERGIPIPKVLQEVVITGLGLDPRVLRPGRPKVKHQPDELSLQIEALRKHAVPPTE